MFLAFRYAEIDGGAVTSLNTLISTQSAEDFRRLTQHRRANDLH
jgi:hypothetical protein